MSDPPGLLDVAGRVARVTAAGSGPGRRASVAPAVGVARRAAEFEAWRAGTTRDTARAAADLADRAALRRTAEAASAPSGSPTILVGAAGIDTREAADDVAGEGWDRTIAPDLSAPFFLAQALVAGMGKGFGRIADFGSLRSRRAFPGGVEQPTRAMAEAWSRGGVEAGASAPGLPTEFAGPVFEDDGLAARNATQTCMGRNGAIGHGGGPRDLDGPLLFLCSPASVYVTGQKLFGDGGHTAR